MSEIVDAHARLLAMAGAGAEYRRDQVDVLDPDDTNGAEIVGHGRDFIKNIQVLDASGAPSVAGKAALRLLARIQPDGDTHLFMRARLDWATDAGEHTSFAGYLISTAGAAALAGAAESPAPKLTEDEVSAMLAGEDGAQKAAELLGEALSHSMQQLSEYGANWLQTYPGSGFWYGEHDGLVRSDGEPDLEAIERSSDYHEAAVRAAKEAEPDLLCMLSDSDFGAVEPAELPTILRWVEQNPDLAVN